MLFNSYSFMLLFLPAVYALWWALAAHVQLRLSMMVAASYLFYGWSRWEFTLLLAASTVVDYAVGARMGSEEVPWKRKALLGVSLAANLGMLGYFKYCGFFAESLNSALQFLRTGAAVHVPDIVLPVGISFYTFQTLSYSIDLYRRQIAPAASLLHFATYVSLFPQLIAGPIVRYRDLEDQINSLPRRVEWPQCCRGIWLLTIGMSQKLLIADPIASGVNAFLQEPGAMHASAAWYALLGYSLQLYFDFAGYSNMARGLGELLGFSFPENFDSPYRAVSIQDFWRRWHITLSTFLRDYLYIPLGGSRRGVGRTMCNAVLVMLLGGLWHGAGWTFVLWGLYHGSLLAGYAMYRGQNRVTLAQPLAVGVTFLAVMLGWLLFRATDMSMASQWFAALFDFGVSATAAPSLKQWCFVAAALAICWFAPSAEKMPKPSGAVAAVALACVMTFCILRFDADSPFLYFQF